MELVAANAQYAKLHEKRPYHEGGFKTWAKERSSKHPYRYDEGVHIYLAPTDLNPGDEFLTEEDANPLARSEADDSLAERQVEV